MNRDQLLVIIPAFNEAKSLPQLISELKRELPEADELIVDDGSTDETYEVARRLGRVIKLPCNLGIGGAVQTGFKYAKHHGYRWCIQVDGDGQHPPGEILKLWKAARAGEANIVAGSRFINKSGFQSTWLRRAGIQWIRGIIKFITHWDITDPTSGFRVMDEKAIAVFAADYPLDYPEPVSIVIAQKRGLTVKEIPVTMRAREAGTSTFAGAKALSYMFRVSCYLFLMRMRGRA